MKKLFVCFFTLLIVVTLVLGSAFSASAKTYNFKLNSGWGTKESGIITKTPNYHLEHTPYNETPGFPNGDFEQGLMYFIGTGGEPTSQVQISQDSNGNHYGKFITDIQWGGLRSIPFVENRVKAGDLIALVCDWRGDDGNFQAVLEQICYKNTDGTEYDRYRIADGGNAKAFDIIADGEDGWSVRVFEAKMVIQEPNAVMPDYFFNIGIETRASGCDAEFDNLRIAKYSIDTGILYNLDGSVMYDINNLGIEEGEDYLTSSMFPNINYDLTYDNVYNSSTSTVNNSELKGNDGNFFFDADGKATVWFWVIIGCGAFIIIAAAATVVVIIVVKKKKRSALPEEESDLSEDANSEEIAGTEDPEQIEESDAE